MDEIIELSIIIVTFNRPNEVIRALQSCRVSNTNYEIIVWDNNSSNDNSLIVSNFCRNSNAPIRYYKSTENLGAGGGKNQAWLKSRGKYVLIMDDDAEIHNENYIESMLEFMKNHPNCAASYSNIYEPDTNHYYDCEFRKKNNSSNEEEVLAFVGGSHIINKLFFPNKNLYPECINFGSEELYASLLIWDSGYSVLKNDKLEILHLPTSVNRHLGKERDRIFIASSYVVKKLLYPKYLLPLVYICFRIHLFKNRISVSEVKSILGKASKNVAESKITTKTLVMLAVKFGLRAIL